MRARRSLLFMPGSNARALDKARTLAADGLIFDLEDAVAPDRAAKTLARRQVVTALDQGGYDGREIIVRINALDSPWGRDDLAALANTGLDALLLPKIETPAQIETVIETLDRIRRGPPLAIWIMIETPRAVLDIDAIAGSHERLAVIVMGTSDLANETRIPDTPDRLGFLPALSLCVFAARAHGLDILDGVHLKLDDNEEFTRLCEQGRALGFDGKTLIHPRQIETANRVFAPRPAEIDRAQRIIEAWRQARADGQGVTVVDGRLVEGLHVEQARRLLALMQIIDQKPG